jgi:hypothetical protein
MPGKLVLLTLDHVWATLEPLQLPLAVMGGIDLSAWECVCSTLDMELLIGLESIDADRILATLQAAGLRPKRHPAVVSVGPSRFMRLVYEPPGTHTELPVDLLFAETAYQRQALTRRMPVRLEGMDRDLAVLSCEDLILFS